MALQDLITRPLDVIAGEAGMQSPGELTESFSGISGARAALEGSRLQEEFGREALAEQELAQRRLEETLAPFVQFGVDRLPEFQQLFQPTVAQSIAASPTVTDLTALADEAIMSNMALNPNAQALLDEGALLTGVDLLSRERGDLLSALGLGQASAAQQAAGGLQTGQQRMDLLSQIGNVQAAGGIGAAQALGQGGQNIAGLGTTLAEGFR